MGGDEPVKEKENHLLTKSNSTSHIPDTSKSKTSKRAYANFDKDLAVRMFGYRVTFSKKKMQLKVPDPKACQTHKPLKRFVQDIVGQLTSNYQQIPKFHSKQKIMIPILDSEEEAIDDAAAEENDETNDVDSCRLDSNES